MRSKPKMYYTVTKEHIDKGLKDNPSACPIALCLKEEGYEQVAVSRGSLYCPTPLNEWAKSKKLSFYYFSEALKAWVDSFDLMKEVPEITIYVDKHKVFIKGEGV